MPAGHVYQKMRLQFALSIRTLQCKWFLTRESTSNICQRHTDRMWHMLLTDAKLHSEISQQGKKCMSLRYCRSSWSASALDHRPVLELNRLCKRLGQQRSGIGPRDSFCIQLKLLIHLDICRLHNLEKKEGMRRLCMQMDYRLTNATTVDYVACSSMMTCCTCASSSAAH